MGEIDGESKQADRLDDGIDVFMMPISEGLWKSDIPNCPDAFMTLASEGLWKSNIPKSPDPPRSYPLSKEISPCGC